MDELELPIQPSKMKTSSSVHDVESEKPPFGSRFAPRSTGSVPYSDRAFPQRFLTDEAEVWTQNAWDHVPPPDDQVEVIAASLSKQRLAPVPYGDKPKYNDKPSRHWFAQST